MNQPNPCSHFSGIKRKVLWVIGECNSLSKLLQCSSSLRSVCKFASDLIFPGSFLAWLIKMYIWHVVSVSLSQTPGKVWHRIGHWIVWLHVHFNALQPQIKVGLMWRPSYSRFEMEIISPGRSRDAVEQPRIGMPNWMWFHESIQSKLKGWEIGMPNSMWFHGTIQLKLQGSESYGVNGSCNTIKDPPFIS